MYDGADCSKRRSGESAFLIVQACVAEALSAGRHKAEPAFVARLRTARETSATARACLTVPTQRRSIPQLTEGILPVRLPNAAPGPLPPTGGPRLGIARCAAGGVAARGGALSQNGDALAAACLAGPGWVTVTTG